MRKELRWTKGLPGNMIKQILEMEPEIVKCVYVMPEFTKFYIYTKNGFGIGVAIYSPIEMMADSWNDDKIPFDSKKGKILAASRAIKALKVKKSSSPIRKEFPRSWKPSQIKRLKEISEVYKYDYKSNYLFGSLAYNEFK